MEACGILGGYDAGQVEQVHRMKNVNPTSVSYQLDPADQLAVTRELEHQGMRIIGIYHSHPGGAAYPSPIDVRQAFFPGTDELNYPGAVYLIVGLSGQEPEVNAYEIQKDGGVRTCPVEIV